MTVVSYVIISHAEHRSLVAAAMKLTYLEGYGVDNWDGYSDAMSSLRADEVHGGEDEQAPAGRPVAERPVADPDQMSLLLHAFKL